MFARRASAMRVVSVESPRAAQNGADASALLMWIAVESSSARDSFAGAESGGAVFTS
jgi:hypothetical protein